MNDQVDVKEEHVEGSKFMSVKLTSQGRGKLLDILQDHLGYIEEEIHEQILNDIQDWMNNNYSQLLDFYAKAVTKGLVPAAQLHEVVEENNALREKFGVESRDFKNDSLPFETVTSDSTAEVIESTKEGSLSKPTEPIVEKTPIEKPVRKSIIDSVQDEKFKPIDTMNGWELRALAKKMGLPIVKGMNKEMIFEMVRDEIKAKAK